MIMTFLLVFILTVPTGDAHEYVVDGDLSWYECEVKGSIAESFDSELNWYCEAK